MSVNSVVEMRCKELAKERACWWWAIPWHRGQVRDYSEVRFGRTRKGAEKLARRGWTVRVLLEDGEVVPYCG